MIVVRVELHSAITGKVTELGRMLICNTGGTMTRRNYSVEVLRGRSTEAFNKRTVQRSGIVMDHPAPSEHVWNLVAKALTNTRYGFKGEPDQT